MAENGTTIAQEEIKAIEQSLPEVGGLVVELENGRLLSTWTKDEMLRLIFKTVRCYQANMQALTAKEGLPF